MLTINIRALIKTFAIIAAVLLAANLVLWISSYYLPFDNIEKFRRLFDFDSEANLPTMFQAGLLLLNAAILLLISRTKKINGNSPYPYWFFWLMVFLYLSIDESAQIHELVMDLIKNRFSTGSIFYFSWVIPGTLIVGAISAVSWKFVSSLPVFSRKRILVSTLLYLSGALGFEFIGGYYVSNFGGTDLPYRLITTTEESLEMAGLICFAHTFLSHLNASFPEFTIALVGSDIDPS